MALLPDRRIIVPHERSPTETLLDLRGLACPMPVLKANRALRDMPPGARLRILATDRASVADFSLTAAKPAMRSLRLRTPQAFFPS